MIPINGGRREIKIVNNNTNEIQATSQSLRRLFGLKERLTPWEKENGRPIYDRLPAVSRSDNNENRGLVLNGLIPSLINNFTINISSGTSVWPTVTTNESSQIIDVSLLGLESSRWFLVYELLDNPEIQTFFYSINNQNISELFGWTTFSVGETPGFESIYAIYNDANNFFKSPGNLKITFSNFISLTKINIPIISNNGSNSQCTLVINNESTIFPEITNNNLIFNINNDVVITEIQFNNLFGNIKNITFDGTIGIDTEPDNSTIGSQLAIYNLEDLEVNQRILNFLAFFETNVEGNITVFRDVRRFTNNSSQDISNWLTSQIDSDLIFYYNEYKNYSNNWMSPLTLGNTIYEREIDGKILDK